MKKRAKKRPVCKPVKAWALVEIPNGKFDIDALFPSLADAVAFRRDEERIVRVEIREVRRKR